MIHLTTVSALEMDEIQEQEHHEEIAILAQIINEQPNYSCAVLAKYQDPRNSIKPQETLSCNLHDFLTISERYDCKNGIDLLVSDDQFLVMMVYGSLYEYQGEHHYTTVALKFMPYDIDEQFIDISKDILGIL